MIKKYIFVTGGVISSLGKGITTSSIGLLLERSGYRVTLQKLDPYINVDAGTMNPYQHGEVYVTTDGAETDLDLGHYERFTQAVINRRSNFTAGSIYSRVIAKEREGKYLGQTVQVVPHITDEIKQVIEEGCAPDSEIAITEIGGTVGDIESLPFLEAIRQIGMEKGREHVLYIHLTLLPFLSTTREVKTKPTQHSVGKLREIGIIPDILVCRTEKTVDESIRNKLSLFCNVDRAAVIEERNVEHSVYELPVIFHREQLHTLIQKRLQLPLREPELKDWYAIYESVRYPKGEVNIALVGKYLDLEDAYKSIVESLHHAGIHWGYAIRLLKVNSEELDSRNVEDQLRGARGMVVPGGFGTRGVEGKIAAIRHAREKKIPFLGLCLGMQCALIEFARHVVGLKEAHSQEFQPETPQAVIGYLENQKLLTQLGATMRLGTYECQLKKETSAYHIYGREQVWERHRHRLEFDNQYRDLFERHGMVFSGVNPQTHLVEMIELPHHPFFIGVQFHPEFQSKPTAPHPLFRAFVEACLKYTEGD